ncbi:hypothetical protein [Spirosoma sp. KNUC1025]|uniref:hypothetical protein n=1 Tax=Spirosoma sp. KNUC1025 TaxID=2894082 RepID=UPI003865170B|nr:hypothetical protein LN737_29625 [Spirosoma sp. KNUC1025]
MKMFLLFPAILVLEFIIALRHSKRSYQAVNGEQVAESVQFFNMYRLFIFALTVEAIASL